MRRFRSLLRSANGLLTAGLLAAVLGYAADDGAQAASGVRPASNEAVLFEELPIVEAAALHAQTLEEAPANVTVIGREEIRLYGYRTLAEALSYVRGFYVSDDQTYQYLGLRGFSLPGDYSTRFLVMLNGHYLTDNIFSSNGFLGQDFSLDMDLVERIEIIRGPSSALYGSNGMFATINIVTRSPVDHPTARASTELGSFGEKKMQISSSTYLGGGANLLLSASTFHNAGRSVFLGDLDNPENSFGLAEGVDKERGYHTFANLVWHDWIFTAVFSNRETHVPNGSFGTIFNDPGNKIQDGRGFVEALYSRQILADGQLRWRFYYDRYRYWGRYDYDLDDETIIDNRDLAMGDWVGSRLSYSFPLAGFGDLTIGGEANFDLRNFQENSDIEPEFIEHLAISRPDRGYGLFVQQESKLSSRLSGYLGARFDDSANHGSFVSPRAGLIYQHSQNTTYKFLYGRSFRNPNAFEKYYEDTRTNIANLDLGPETMDTFEIAWERRLTQRLKGVVTAYHYRLNDLIEGIENSDEVVQFQNISRTSAAGLEMEVNGRLLDWLRLAASYSIQSPSDSAGGVASVNSPRHVAKLRFAVPLLTPKLQLAAALRYLSSRQTLTRASVAPAYLSDLTFSTTGLHRHYDLRFGIRNLFDRRFYDPVGSEQILDRLPQIGRTVFVKLIWRTGE